MANQYSATLITKTPLIEVGDVVGAYEFKSFDIDMYQAITRLTSETIAGVGTVATSGASTTLTVTTGNFKKVYPGATIYNTVGAAPVAIGVVVSVTDSTNVVLEEAVEIDEGVVWSYKNVDDYVPYDTSGEKGDIFGVALASFKASSGSKYVQVKRKGVYPSNQLSTADKTTAQITGAIHNAMQKRCLIAVNMQINEY